MTVVEHKTYKLAICKIVKFFLIVSGLAPPSFVHLAKLVDALISKISFYGSIGSSPLMGKGVSEWFKVVVC
jgi:hypothetical protein